MSVNINNAMAAYRNAASAVSQGRVEPPKAEETTAGGGFAGLVKESIEQAVDVQRKAETLSAKGIAGQADMRDVVLAVNSAEQALSTVVAVRDKVVSAYQEILRMPI